MSLTSGPNLGLLQNGSQGEQHYAELLRFFRGVDGLTMLSVIDRSLATPPNAPADGARYLVAASATGAWAGKSGSIARYSADVSAWEFYTPHKGWFTHVETESALYRFDGAAWALWQGPASAGWTAATGTASRASFDTASVTTAQLAQTVKALIDDLLAQGRLSA